MEKHGVDRAERAAADRVFRRDELQQGAGSFARDHRHFLELSATARTRGGASIGLTIVARRVLFATIRPYPAANTAFAK